MPVSAVLLSLIVLKEPISLSQLAGIVLVVSGIVFVSLYKPARSKTGTVSGADA
jgi:drug/metabolite transporter (DMT)-like permease